MDKCENCGANNGEIGVRFPNLGWRAAPRGFGVGQYWDGYKCIRIKLRTVFREGKEYRACQKCANKYK